MTDHKADDPRQLAAEIGLENPPPEVLAQLPAAAATARRHRAALQSVALTPADEPALVFRAAEGRES